MTALGLSTKQVTALKIARKLDANIRINWKNQALFNKHARRIWDEAVIAKIPVEMVHGFFATLEK